MANNITILDGTGTSVTMATNQNATGAHQPIQEIIPNKRMRDVMGKMKISMSRNIYEADFEYGTQPLRWEAFTAGSGTVIHLPGEGGVRMRLTTASGDLTLRQSRPYHRYQPGKAMFMATAVNFGVNQANQIQRVGYFDDNNGIFFEQSNPVAGSIDANNPAGMSVVVRTDAQSALTNGLPTDTRFPAYMWSDPQGIASSIDWTKIQMLWMEYAWYGAGALRWGVYLNGEPYILHEVGTGNNSPAATNTTTGLSLTAGSSTSVTITGGGSLGWKDNQFKDRWFSYTQSGTTYYAKIVSHVVSTGVITLQSLIAGDTGSLDNTAGAYGTRPITPVPGSITAWSILTLPNVNRGWSRTGNLPVRYEQRNTNTTAAQNDMIHYGVSVLVEGGVDDQRGFTYAYGSPYDGTTPVNSGRRSVPGNSTTGKRFPVVSLRGRTMGTQEYTQASAAITSGTTSTLVASSATWTVNQWAGRMVNYGTPAAGMLPNTARIVSNTATTLNLVDNITGGTVTAPTAGQSYTIGQINRGQVLPRRLQITSNKDVYVEIVTSSPGSSVNLTGANFVTNAAASNSFAVLDNSATAFTTSGEVVYSIFVPANQPVDQPIENLFPLYNSVRGNNTDILTVLVTNTDTTNAASVSAQIIGQEAMS